MIISGLSGNEIYCLSQKGFAPGRIVVGNSVYSLGAVRGLTSGIRTLTGGEIHSLTELISDGRHAAISRLETEAAEHAGQRRDRRDFRAEAGPRPARVPGPGLVDPRSPEAASSSLRPAPARTFSARSTPATNRVTSSSATSATPWAWAAG